MSHNQNITSTYVETYTLEISSGTGSDLADLIQEVTNSMDGRLGSDLLRNSQVTFDIQHNKLTIIVEASLAK